MRVLVVLAHPDPESFNHAIARRVVDTLHELGHSVVLRDLYAEGFRAAMSAAEHVAYQGDTPVIDEQVAAHVADLRGADALVVVYPTWWSTMPAVLKGWCERVLVPGVGFVFNRRGKVRPGATNIRRILGISTYGSSWWYLRATCDNGRRTIMRSMRLSTGWRTRASWLAMYRMDTATAARREAFLAACADRVRKVVA